MIRSRYTAAVTDKPWWLAGGIPASACVAAYQAVGASDYVASKVNLANPGTYNAVDGAAYPTWDAVNGWKFDGTTHYLDTGIVPNSGWSVICRFSNCQETGWCYFFGLSETNKMFFLNSRANISTKLRYGYGVENEITTAAMVSGTMGMGGPIGYKNGQAVGALGSFTGSPSLTCYIGAFNPPNFTYIPSIYIQALALYRISISGYAHAILHNSIMAL